jgi:hypothetical protein
MQKHWFFFAGVLAVCSVPGFSQTSPILNGDYAGMLGQMHVKLHVVTGSDGSLSATVDLPDQHMFASQCTDIQLNGSALSYSVPKFHGTWTGVLSADGSVLTGVWSAGQPQALNMTRVGGGQSAAAAATASPAVGRDGPGDATEAVASGGQYPPCPMGSLANYWTGTTWAPLHAPQVIGGKAGFSMGSAFKNGPLMAGTMGQTTIEQFKGAESSTTVVGDKAAFCFFNGANMSPTYLLGTVGVKGDKREFEVRRATGPLNWIEPKQQQTVDQSLFGNNSILVTPKTPLPPGQYIVGMNSSNIYDFGVR